MTPLFWCKQVHIGLSTQKFSNGSGFSVVRPRTLNYKIPSNTCIANGSVKENSSLVREQQIKMLCRRLNTLAVAGSTIYCSVQPCNIPILKCISCQCWGQTFSSLHKESEQHFGFKHRNDTNPIAIAFILVLFPIIFKTSIGAVALAAALAARV